MPAFTQLTCDESNLQTQVGLFQSLSFTLMLYFQYSSDLLNNNNYAPSVFPQALCAASR